jgi:hypothetical protein
MSFCGWTEGDVYAIASTAGGYLTCVAERRPVDVRRDAGARALVDATWENIPLPFAGCGFHDYDLDHLEARLKLLRRIGYVIPDRAFAEIAEERQEGAL